MVKKVVIEASDSDSEQPGEAAQPTGLTKEAKAQLKHQQSTLSL